MSEPSPYVKVSVGNHVQKGMPKPKSTDPKWEENMQFLVHDPRNQDLLIEVRWLGSPEIPTEGLIERVKGGGVGGDFLIDIYFIELILRYSLCYVAAMLELDQLYQYHWDQTPHTFQVPHTDFVHWVFSVLYYVRTNATYVCFAWSFEEFDIEIRFWFAIQCIAVNVYYFHCKRTQHYRFNLSQ